MKTTLTPAIEGAVRMPDRFFTEAAAGNEPGGDQAHVELHRVVPAPAPARRTPGQWLRRKIARTMYLRHALMLWTGNIPGRRPGRIELAVTPLVRCWITIIPQVASDLLSLTLATVISFWILRTGGHVPFSGIHRIMPLLSATLMLGFLSTGLYSVIGVNPVVELRQFTRLSTLVFAVAITGSYLVSAKVEWRLFFLLEWLLSLVLLPLVRSLVRPFYTCMQWWGQPALVFGLSDEAVELAKSILREPSCGVRPVALVTNDDAYPNRVSDIPVLNIHRAQQLVRRTRISYGVVLDSSDIGNRESTVARAMAIPLSHVLVMSNNADLPTLWRDTCECAGMPALQVQNRLIMPWPRVVKRASDLLLTITGGLAIAPVLLLIAIAVKLTSKGPVFFGHTRIGKCGRRFKAWKFRTMVKNAPAILEKYLTDNPELREEWNRHHKLRHDPRVTSLGRFLRKSSLDEFPQLWNILRGEMSLVGPRPIVNDEIIKYGHIYEKYMQVRPGLTGMWQVSGRSNTSYAERIRLDDYYVRNWSPWLDLHLLTRTIYSLIIRRGAY